MALERNRATLTENFIRIQGPDRNSIYFLGSDALPNKTRARNLLTSEGFVLYRDLDDIEIWIK